MRNPISLRILVTLVLLLILSPTSVHAQRAIQIQASFNSTQTDQGVLVVLAGRVSELTNMSVPNAVISIQVNNPQGTSILVAIRYTNQLGTFQDSFLLASNSPAGNYTAYLVADKPGYDTAHLTLTFTFSTPDFSIDPSVRELSLQQGQTGSLTVTVLSLRNFNQRVNLTAIDPPSGVNLRFDPTSVVPSTTATVNVIVSNAARAGNYTVTLLAVSGSLSHKTSFQLRVTPGPTPINPLFLVAGGVALALLITVGLLSRSRRRSRQKAQILEEFMKQASGDAGYLATARVIARLEELRATGKIDESAYRRLKRDYEKRLEKSK